jgi:hypothetical protein
MPLELSVRDTAILSVTLELSKTILELSFDDGIISSEPDVFPAST